MQQPITRRGVYEPSLTATISGRAVDLASVSMDRDLPDPLASGALTAATGTLVTVEGQDVVTTVATPWDPATQWPPTQEAPASVSMDTGAGPVQLLGGGRVTDAAGGSDARAVTIGVSDRYQSLDRTISWDGLADAMPSESEAVSARYVGLQAVHVTDRILRHCGWHSTPPRIGYTSLSVPAQGSMWPEAGTVVTCQAVTGVAYPGWLTTPWGIGVTDVDAYYRLAGLYTIRGRGRMEMTAMTSSRASESTARLEALSTGSGIARISWSQTTAYLWIRDSSGAWANIVSTPRLDGLLYATVEVVSGNSVRATLRSGSNVSMQVLTVPATVLDSVVNEGRVVAEATSGGFQIAFPSTAGSLAGWSPSAVLYPRAGSRNSLRVLPDVEGQNCADLLAEQCEAECATYWIDETGVLRWWDLARLEGRSTVATLTSDDDITEDGFTWSHDLSRVKSRVAVKWLEPARDWSWRTTVDLWQGGGGTVQPNTATVSDPMEDWINVPDDEVWIMPSLSLSRIGPDNLGDFNLGIGSHYGAVTRTSDDRDRWAQLSGSFLVSVERLTGTAFKMTKIWTGAGQAFMRSPSEESISDVWRVRRGMDLPIIRGKAKFTLTDRLTYSAQSGPTTAPEHLIDVGWWIQRPEQAQYTADYAGARVTTSQPVLSSVALIPVPGLQLGDMVEVQDTAVTRLTVRGVVVGDSRSVDADMTMRHGVAIRPVAVSRNGIAWEEWGRVLTPDQYQTWGARQNPKAWQQWGQDPLAGEDY